MTTIPLIPPAVRDYLRSFGVTSIALKAKARVIKPPNPISGFTIDRVGLFFSRSLGLVVDDLARLAEGCVGRLHSRSPELS